MEEGACAYARVRVGERVCGGSGGDVKPHQANGRRLVGWRLFNGASPGSSSPSSARQRRRQRREARAQTQVEFPALPNEPSLEAEVKRSEEPKVTVWTEFYHCVPPPLFSLSADVRAATKATKMMMTMTMMMAVMKKWQLTCHHING